jgi:nicotinate-nucleotide--dimethylbenzimidazole phosphoribosyltransferase
MTLLSDIQSLAAVETLAETLPSRDTEAVRAATERQNSLTKPPGALGRLEALAAFMAGWQGTARPTIDRAQAVVFAGNHGVCAQGVNPFPQDVTAQMVANFENGGAAINQLCRATGAELSVVALDLDQPTGDITQGPAMSEQDTLMAMRRGAEAVEAQADVLVLGEMGIGNSTIAAALAMAGFGGGAEDWVGRGTGSDEAGLARKTDAVARAVAHHATVLRARALRLPVILDGFICTAAAVPLYKADPRFLDHCVVGHLSREAGHAQLISALQQEPILSLDMALGEGSGAALALGVLRAALECHNGMATFAEAGVADA